MDPSSDCPICFEAYASGTQHERWAAPCCAQALCRNCSDALRRCPFCRATWDGEDHAGEGANQWLRVSLPNPVLVAASIHAARTTAPSILAVGLPALRAAGQGLLTVARAGGVMIAEASPAATAGAAVGTAALVGGVALAVASQHSEVQAQNLQRIIRSRGQHWYPAMPWYHTAETLWEALHWYLAPQTVGVIKGAKVYHGSPWFSAAREQHLMKVRALCTEMPREMDPSALPTPSQQLWGELSFCFSLWLDFNPHTANWGTCASYGSPPLYLCWHNRWREDLRHAVSDLARCVLTDPRLGDTGCAKERCCALCLLATLDHVLSWDVDTPDFGHSELIVAEFRLYRNFCSTLLSRFLASWGCAQAWEHADAVDPLSFVSHVGSMASREVPQGFSRVW